MQEPPLKQLVVLQSEMAGDSHFTTAADAADGANAAPVPQAVRHTQLESLNGLPSTYSLDVH